MKKKTLNAAMTVHATAGAGLANAPGMADKEATRFTDQVATALKKLVRLSTGRKIVDEIVNSGKQCIIFSGDMANSGAAMPNPQGLQSQIDDHLSDQEMMASAAEGARALDRSCWATPSGI